MRLLVGWLACIATVCCLASVLPSAQAQHSTDDYELSGLEVGLSAGYYRPRFGFQLNGPWDGYERNWLESNWPESNRLESNGPSGAWRARDQYGASRAYWPRYDGFNLYSNPGYDYAGLNGHD